MSEWFWLNLFIFFIILLFLFLISIPFIILYKNKKQREKQKSINTNAIRYLDSHNFVCSKLFIKDSVSYNSDDCFKKMAFVDKTGKRICFLDYENNALIALPFDRISKYEVYENEQANTSFAASSYNNIGFGFANTIKTCKNLKLIIYVNDYDTPQIVYNLVESGFFKFVINKNSSAYNKIISSLQEFIAILEIIKNETASEQQQNGTIKKNFIEY